MAENSNIEWTDHTFNGWIGCTKVSPACDNCYAENWGKRFGVEWGAGKERRLTSDAYWRKPLAWNAKADRDGTRPKVFANSLSDVFDAEVPDEWRDRLFALIGLTPNLDWMVLTKRPKVALDYFTGNRKSANGVAMPPLWHIGMAVDQPDWHDIKDLPLPNLWLGTTVENQAMADLRIPLLQETPAAKRFLSCEPLLGPVDLFMDGLWCDDCSYCSDGSFLEWDTGENTCPHCCDSCGKSDDVSIDLVIAGGESGKGSRPSHPDWFRGLRDQCVAADVPFFFKQWGDWLPQQTETAGPETPDWMLLYRHGGEDIPDGRWPNYDAGEVWTDRVGKKFAGRLLDGREWSEMPS